MKRLEDCKWKEFWLSDVFDIDATSSSIDKKKLNGKSGNYPYITRTDKNNGFELFVDVQSKYCTDEGNVISIGLDTQTVFYQNSEFYTGQNIQVLRNQQLNKYIALFIIPLLKIQLRKFNWGGNGATLGRLRRLKVVLPTINNEPDYDFMEKYMREVEHKQKDRYKNYIRSKIEEVGFVESLETKKWREFRIEDIFNVFSGVRLTKENQNEGLRPFAGATDSNNGITEFVSNTNESLDQNVLGVNYNGSVVENFYHPYETIFSDDVKRLHLKHYKDDKYVFLFMKAAILKQKVKYQYGYKFNAERMKRQIIKLPVNSHNEPDYAFMENYMRRKEYEILEKYQK